MAWTSFDGQSLEEGLFMCVYLMECETELEISSIVQHRLPVHPRLRVTWRCIQPYAFFAALSAFRNAGLRYCDC